MPDASVPPVLYHYTNAFGLKGILEAGSLWATDAEFLNDAQELQFGRSELCDALRARAESLYSSNRPEDYGSPEYSRASVVHSAVRYLETGDVNVPIRTERMYVACFCAHDDLLSQWRGYAGGGGYAIGLRSEVFVNWPPVQPQYLVVQQPENLETTPQFRPVLVQVQYGDAAIASMIDHVVREIAPRPTGHPGVQGWTQAVTLALPALAGIKHSAFAEEQEWRLLVSSMEAQRGESFRVGQYGLIPYIEIPLNLPDAVHDIVVGPGGHSDLHVTGVARLLHGLGLHEVHVRVSSAPFRG
jgi:hypothetical protein